MTTTTEQLTGGDLRTLTDKWVNSSFNMIQVNVYEKMCDNMLFEHIRQGDPDYIEFINNYGLHKEFKDEMDCESEEATASELKQFCEAETSWDNWDNEQRDANYPMWNTLFEFKSVPSEEMIQSAIDAGFGVIEGMDDFNITLFVSGCGYSFYAQHWIPLFLAMPWNSDLKEECKDVKFDDQ